MGICARQSAGSNFDPDPDRKAKEPAAKPKSLRACGPVKRRAVQRAWLGWLTKVQVP